MEKITTSEEREKIKQAAAALNQIMKQPFGQRADIPGKNRALTGELQIITVKRKFRMEEKPNSPPTVGDLSISTRSMGTR